MIRDLYNKWYAHSEYTFLDAHIAIVALLFALAIILIDISFIAAILAFILHVVLKVYLIRKIMGDR